MREQVRNHLFERRRLSMALGSHDARVNALDSAAALDCNVTQSVVTSCVPRDESREEPEMSGFHSNGLCKPRRTGHHLQGLREARPRVHLASRVATEAPATSAITSPVAVRGS